MLDQSRARMFSQQDDGDDFGNFDPVAETTPEQYGWLLDEARAVLVDGRTLEDVAPGNPD